SPRSRCRAVPPSMPGWTSRPTSTASRCPAASPAISRERLRTLAPTKPECNSRSPNRDSLSILRPEGVGEDGPRGGDGGGLLLLDAVDERQATGTGLGSDPRGIEGAGMLGPVLGGRGVRSVRGFVDQQRHAFRVRG